MLENKKLYKRQKSFGTTNTKVLFVSAHPKQEFCEK